MKVVVGLGNPGKEYEGTRHNVGFRVVELLAREAGASFRRSLRVRARTCACALDGVKVLLVEPLTFMNLSGDAVAAAMRWHRAEPADLTVVYDDADLPTGALRIRPKGGPGGHNGMKSVIARLGTEDFVRVRIGVGRDPGGNGLVDHVLGEFSRGERPAVDEAVQRAAAAVRVLLREGTDRAMNQFNG